MTATYGAEGFAGGVALVVDGTTGRQNSVIPAKAGIHSLRGKWVPAFAGTTIDICH